MAINYRIAVTEDNGKLKSLDIASAEGELAKYSRNKGGLFDVEGYFRKGGSFWVAEEGDRVVGMVGVRKSDNGTMKVKGLRVHPDYRKMGIARTLMDLVEDYCRKRGEKEIILGVNKESLPAISLYKSLGYVKYDEEVYGPGHSVYFFRKPLS